MSYPPRPGNSHLGITSLLSHGITLVAPPKHRANLERNSSVNSMQFTFAAHHYKALYPDAPPLNRWDFTGHSKMSYSVPRHGA